MEMRERARTLLVQLLLTLAEYVGYRTPVVKKTGIEVSLDLIEKAFVRERKDAIESGEV
jgi:hypothetical protein